MPERIASTDPFKLITEFVGSGPMKFADKEWVPGSKAVFTRFEGYKPRDEPSDWSAGGKRMYFRPDRVDHHPRCGDRGGGAAERRSGLGGRTRSPDLVPLLKRQSGLSVDIADPLGNIGDMRFNHLNPPFNDVRARRAVMMALNQADFMGAVVGEDPNLWKPCPSYFTPGTPAFSDQGGQILEGPRKYDAAKALLKEAGYNGEKIAMLVPTDIPITKAQGDVAADLLARIGMNVDYQALDWGTVGARRAKKDPVAQGGWNIFFTWHAGADCINPAPYTALVATGDKAWFGWPKSDAVQAGIADWYAAPDAAAEKAALVKTNIAAFEDVVYAPDGVLPDLSILEQEAVRRGQGAVPGVLGRQEGLMFAYTLRRVASTIPVMAIVALFVFSLLYLAPGDPAAIIAGDQASPADVERIRASLGLDRPFLVRFGEWVWHVLNGDLGQSIFTNLPVTHMIAQRVEPTVSLMVLTLVFSIVVAVPMGVVAAWKQGTWIDRVVMLLAVFGFSVPVFVVGYIMAYVFALQLEWLPVQGYTPLSSGVWPWLSNLILPMLTLGGAFVALIARITRATMLEVLSQDYVRTARAKGVGQRPILFVHALKNAAVPIVTVIGLGVAGLIGGAVVTESVFAIPGVGRLVVDAILRRDYPVIQGVVLIFSFVYVLVNLCVDLLYTVFDPRIRY